MAFWRRHRWTALRSLLIVALLHRLHFLAFLAASSPVWLLAAFLLGAVLVNSEPSVPLAAASEDEDRHLYKKIRRQLASSSESSMDVVDKAAEEEAAVAWTADDEHSIQSIGSLELERDARLEKLMSRRTTQRNLAVRHGTNNPLDHSPSSSYDDHAAAAAMDDSSPLLVQHTNPFDIDIQQQQQQREKEGSDPDQENDKEAVMHGGSFTAGAAQPSRFKPYFVADVPEGGGAGRDASSNSSTAGDQQVPVRVEEAPAATCAWDGKGNGTTVMAVDVELISDSSDDDMSLQGGDGIAPDDEEDSFEVENITQQVAAGVTAVVEAMSDQGHRHPQQHEDDNKKDASIASGTDESTLASVEENQQRKRHLTEIREHHILGTVPIIDSFSTSAVGAVVAAAPTPPAAAAAGLPAPPQPAAAPTPPAAAAGPQPAATAAVASTPPSGKLSSKSKVASKKIDPKKAVFGFFRK